MAYQMKNGPKKKVKPNPKWRNIAFKLGFTNALVKKGGKWAKNPFSKAK